MGMAVESSAALSFRQQSYGGSFRYDKRDPLVAKIRLPGDQPGVRRTSSKRFTGTTQGLSISFFTLMFNPSSLNVLRLFGWWTFRRTAVLTPRASRSTISEEDCISSTLRLSRGRFRRRRRIDSTSCTNTHERPIRSNGSSRSNLVAEDNAVRIEGQRIVVCGAGGFIGGHLVKHLKANGALEIRAVDIKPWISGTKRPRMSRTSRSIYKTEITVTA